MLCVIPPNVIPTRDKLENSALNNPDGFGFAIVIPSENRIHVERTMNADASISRFLEMREKYPEGYATWHARYATHGSTTVDNCHPFQVGIGNTQTYLAHNGILPVLEPVGDTRSDTRIFAEDILPAIGGVTALDNEQVWNILEDFTQGSKVVILTVDPRAKHQCYLLHENKGWKDSSGVWWSNQSCYLSTPSFGFASPYSYGLKDDKAEKWVDCETCESFFEVSQMIDGYCKQCGTCVDCKTYVTECLCYKGSSYDKKKAEDKVWDAWTSQFPDAGGGWRTYE
jgi:glutamine amidotransferase